MRPDEIVRFLSDSPFFQALAQEERVAFAQLGRVCRHAPGEVLFRPRQAPSALYLVADGVVEVCRSEVPGGEAEPVAYLGPGATLAESKVITGTAFSSLAQFPEGGTTIQWLRPQVLRKLYSSREFSMQYLHNLARRLEGSFATLGARTARLGGNLEHFDLPTILQTVVESGAAGTLEVSDSRGSKFGAIHVADRAVGPMACGVLTGVEAFLEILVSPPERGSFTFTSTAASLAGAQRFELTGLLFEAARISDEYRRFASELAPEVVLGVATRQMSLAPEGDPELLEQVWRAIAAEPMGWGALAERLPFSRGQIALAVRDLMRCKAVRSADAEPSEELTVQP
jgi:CRP-like cAMP-binding protein